MSTEEHGIIGIRTVTITLIGLMGVLNELQAGTHQSVSIATLITFCEVAREEGRTPTELGRHLRMPDSTISRQLTDLGDRDRNHNPGFGLVVGRRDLQDRRMWRYELTPKGRRFLQKVLGQTTMITIEKKG